MTDQATDRTRLAITAYAEGLDPSRARQLLPFPSENTGFTERRSVYIEKPAASGWTFRVDDEPLPDAAASVNPAWRWVPGFYAGEVTAELEGPDGRVVETYLLDVSPSPDKVGRLLFAGMVQEIWDEEPALVLGSEPARTLIGTLGHDTDPLVSLARLRLYGSRLLSALHAISSRPIYATRQTRERVPLHQARRVDRRTALAALRNPNALQVIVGTHEQTRHMSHDTNVLLDVPRLEYHLDGAANRCITALALAVARRIREATSVLERSSQTEEPSDTRTALAPRWPARQRFLNGLSQHLREILSQRPFAEVIRAEITAAGLNAAAAHPLYARAHGLAWRILRTGVAGPPTDERLWISPTWEIYERWCFVRLARILREALPDLRWERVRKHPSGAGAAWRGMGDSRNIELLLQPLFLAWDRSTNRIWRSLSGQLIPDLILTTDDGSGPSFIVLDAKYRVDRESVLDAMASAHKYHDALRYRGHLPQRSVLLVPASGGAPWLEQPEFHTAHSVGIVPLGPALPAEPAGPLIQTLRL